MPSWAFIAPGSGVSAVPDWPVFSPVWWGNMAVRHSARAFRSENDRASPLNTCCTLPTHAPEPSRSSHSLKIKMCPSGLPPFGYSALDLTLSWPSAIFPAFLSASAVLFCMRRIAPELSQPNLLLRNRFVIHRLRQKLRQKGGLVIGFYGAGASKMLNSLQGRSATRVRRLCAASR